MNLQTRRIENLHLLETCNARANMPLLKIYKPFERTRKFFKSLTDESLWNEEAVYHILADLFFMNTLLLLAAA